MLEMEDAEFQCEGFRFYPRHFSPLSRLLSSSSVSLSFCFLFLFLRSIH